MSSRVPTVSSELEFLGIFISIGGLLGGSVGYLSGRVSGLVCGALFGVVLLFMAYLLLPGME